MKAAAEAVCVRRLGVMPAHLLPPSAPPALQAAGLAQQHGLPAALIDVRLLLPGVECPRGATGAGGVPPTSPGADAAVQYWQLAPATTIW